MSKQRVDQLGRSVGFVTAVDKKGAVRILNRSGVNVSNLTPNREIHRALIQKLVSGDEMFFKMFQAVLAENTRLVKKLKAGKNRMLNADGSFSGSYSADGSGGFFSGFNAGDILGAGANIFTTIKNNEAQQKLAEQQAQIATQNAQNQLALGNQQLELERLRLEQLKAQQGASAPNKTLLYGGLGLVAVLVIGGLVIAMRK